MANESETEYIYDQMRDSMVEHNSLIKEFDFKNHRANAIEEYQKIRPIYEQYAYVIRNILVEAFKAKSIKIHSIEARAKTVESFGNKAAKPSSIDPNRPQYPTSLTDITDLAGVRVIVFFPNTLDLVDSVIKTQFEVKEKSDKALLLIEEQKFGYASIHYLICLKENRTKLDEYSRFKDLIGEIQVRTILQHAWAEIEHDIQYKAVETLPNNIRRRFMSLAGMLEIADREFQAIQDEDERIRVEAQKSVNEGNLVQVEITPDALKTYLDKKLGPDGRMTDFSYQWTAKVLRNLGFANFEQIEECIHDFDDNRVSKIASAKREGQTTRFEYLLQAGMGQNYVKFHPWKKFDWFIDSNSRLISKLKNAGIEVGSYAPSEKSQA